MKENLKGSKSVAQLIADKNKKQTSMTKKKEVLKEVLEVMKLTIGLNNEEDRTEVPYIGRLYFHDEQKKEAKLLMGDIPLLNISSNQALGFQGI